MKRRIALLSGTLLIASFLAPPGSLDGAGRKSEASTAAMKLHHLHIMMNHGLSMATEGSNLVMIAGGNKTPALDPAALQMAAQGSSLIMIAQMGMAGDVDSFSLEHGKNMMAQARDLFNETMKGKVMMDMHRKGYSPGKAPLMKMTHELGEAVWNVMELLSRMTPAH
jgi:hypothetical protein